MLPEAFLDRMKEMLGEDFPAFVESFEGENHRAMRINIRKAKKLLTIVTNRAIIINVAFLSTFIFGR